MRGNTVRLTDQVTAAWNTVARFDDGRTTQCYQTTQWAVDQPPADGFPVEVPDIAGSEPRPTERLTGRLARSRAAGAGAPSGR